MPPLEIQVFSPSSRTCRRRPAWRSSRARRRRSRPPARTARRRRSPCRRAPAADSAASAPSVPNSEIEPVPSPCMAKAKSASPSRNASISRARQSVRTSSVGCSPPCAAGTTALRKPGLAQRLDARAAGGVDVVVRQRGRSGVGPARELVARSARWRVVEERPARGCRRAPSSIALEHRLLLRGEGADRRARNPRSPCRAPAPPPRPRSRSRPTSPIPSPACAWSCRCAKVGPSASSCASFVRLGQHASRARRGG